MNKEPEDKTRSIREKYNRRLFNLRLILKDYIIHANERLINGGNIRNREETEKILNKAQELKSILPILKDEKVNIEAMNTICKTLGLEDLNEDEIKIVGGV